jgi:DNA-binding CsgD family transcriptional regulator
VARQGEFVPARAEAERALRLSPAAFRDDGLLPLAELAIWQGHDEEAATVVAEGLQQATEAQEEDHPHRYCSWYPLALRLEADRAERATARRMPEQADGARRRVAPVVAALDRLAAWERLPRYPEVGCTLALARAELSRLQGQSNPERWQAAVLAWEQLERPFEAAYARFRQAEALLASHAPRSQAQLPLQLAYRTATTLGAAPLKREVELLAQRGRLRLDATIPQASPTTTMSPVATFGLTRREAEVLALVAEGRTNRQIGQALFITPKTASLHVSRILAKLGVAGRGEAAAIAHRLGLDKR